MQTAYLAGEEGGDMTTAYKGKTHSKGKEKVSKELDLAKPKARDMAKDLERKDQVNYP